jgi:ribonuclease T
MALTIAQRFRGFLPVVVDVETGGFDSRKDALLEIAAVMLHMNDEGQLVRGDTIAKQVLPFKGANLDPAALKFIGLKDPWHPFRMALEEKDALEAVFDPIRKEVKATGCTRAILVGHNAWFDLGFVKTAAERCKIKKNPFHAFSTFDTVSLAALAYGQTVLARAAREAGLSWNEEEAHSAAYDAEQTADLFCTIVNRWDLTFPNTAFGPEDQPPSPDDPEA